MSGSGGGEQVIRGRVHPVVGAAGPATRDGGAEPVLCGFAA